MISTISEHASHVMIAIPSWVLDTRPETRKTPCEGLAIPARAGDLTADGRSMLVVSAVDPIP